MIPRQAMSGCGKMVLPVQLLHTPERKPPTERTIDPASTLDLRGTN